MSLFNRKLLVSVFNAQEAREAVLGGGRIIDSEDPKSALGNISPRNIMDISDTVLDFRRDLEVQLSTNIGEDQLLFRRSQSGFAIEKSRYEIAGKASQAALGVAMSMGTRVHPVNYVKVGVDGMEVDKVGEVLSEIVWTLNRTETLSHVQVMSVLFAQDLNLWTERRAHDGIRKVLVELREFSASAPTDPDAFDISRYAVNTLRDFRTGGPLFTDPTQVSLSTLIQRGALPPGVDSSFIRTNGLFEHRRYFPQIAATANKTTRSVIKAMVDVTAESGANGIMIDTSILSKVSNICLVDTSGSRMIDVNSLVVRDGIPQRGILGLDDLKFFVDYCHYRGIAANAAGSIESYQAQQLWALIPELDQTSSRGSSSAVDRNPYAVGHETSDTRQHRVIKRTLVRGLAPPEHGGVLNLPLDLREANSPKLQALVDLLSSERKAQDLPPLQTYWVDKFGAQTPATFQ